MKKKLDNRQINVIILLVGILGLSIGLATFSNTLTIKSGTTVKPNPDKFRISVSDSSTETSSDSISPSFSRIQNVEPPAATNAIIDNSDSKLITISNMDVTFTTPGQYVEYNFYLHNVGSYDVYTNVPSTKVTCKAREGTTDLLVQEACKCILVRINRYETDNYLTGFNHHKLEKNTYIKLRREISYTYDCSARADGPFDVEIEDLNILVTSSK